VHSKLTEASLVWHTSE